MRKRCNTRLADKRFHSFGILQRSSPQPRLLAIGRARYTLIADVIGASFSSGRAEVQVADSINHPLPDESSQVWFTDPPYYDAVPYADLSDFFLVWLRRTLPSRPLLRDPFDPDNPLSPKTREAVQDETKLNAGRPKDRRWFEGTMAEAFAEGRRVLK